MKDTEDFLDIFHPPMRGERKDADGKRFLPQLRKATTLLQATSKTAKKNRKKGYNPRWRAMGARGPLRRSGENSFSQRVIVKARVVPIGKKGAGNLKAHLSYIQREGVSLDGERGQVYGNIDELQKNESVLAERVQKETTLGAENDAGFGTNKYDLTLQKWSQDRHHFRFIISPENAHELDLAEYITQLVTNVEEDLGTKLEWLAVNHYNTDNPHTHLLIRGKDDQGKDLIIAPTYMSHGFRNRARELADLKLGLRTEYDIEKSVEREITQERYTSLDHELLRLDKTRVITLSVHGGMTGKEIGKYDLLMGRLRYLEKLSLATVIETKIEHGASATTWKLDDDLQKKLRDMGMRGDIIKTMHKALKGEVEQHVIVDMKSPLVKEITGRVVEKGLSDEMFDKKYVIIQAIDGRSYYCDIGTSSAFDAVTKGATVRLQFSSSAKLKKSDQNILSFVEGRGGVYSSKEHLQWARNTEELAAKAESYVDSHIKRLQFLERSGLVEKVGEGKWRVPADLEARLKQHSEHQKAAAFQVQILSKASLSQEAKNEGISWLDSLLADSSSQKNVIDFGYGNKVKEALGHRKNYLLEKGRGRMVKEKFIIAPDYLRQIQSLQQNHWKSQQGRELKS